MYKKHVDYALDCASEHVAGQAATARCVRCMCVCVMWIVNPAKPDLSRAITPNVYVVVSKVSKCRAADSVTQNRQKWLRMLVSVHIAVKCGCVCVCVCVDKMTNSVGAEKFNIKGELWYTYSKRYALLYARAVHAVSVYNFCTV